MTTVFIRKRYKTDYVASTNHTVSETVFDQLEYVFRIIMNQGKTHIIFISLFSIVIIIFIVIYIREFGFAYKRSNFFQIIDWNLASRNGGPY